MKPACQKTKIVATIGPASKSRAVMEGMINAGMNVARLNFAHGTPDSHTLTIETLRAAARSTGQRIAIMADLPGPKIRVGQLAYEPIELKPESSFILTTRDIIGDTDRVSINFSRFPFVFKPGDTLFLNDGIIQLEVLKIEGDQVFCRVIIGGELRSHKGLNLPGIDLGVSAFTDRDHEWLKFAFEQGLDAVSQSFVESAADIVAVREAATAMGYHPYIIAKIERARALEHTNDILDVADGIMVARGDLGVEIPIEEIALIQKKLIHQANSFGKPVITATQLLESMTANRRPTRAESTDVANAVLDGTDCVMLSEESAMGNYPVEAVAMLAKIAAVTESCRLPPDLSDALRESNGAKSTAITDVIALSVEMALEYISSAAVFVRTHSGLMARSIARFKPPVWIVAVSSLKATCQQLVFTGGVYPVYEPNPPQDWNEYIHNWLLCHGSKGNLAILVEGPSLTHPVANHRMEIIRFNREAAIVKLQTGREEDVTQD